ncbi:hypothetical protein MRX96_026874 [Rhipicephalus microplus]
MKLDVHFGKVKIWPTTVHRKFLLLHVQYALHRFSEVSAGMQNQKGRNTRKALALPDELRRFAAAAQERERAHAFLRPARRFGAATNRPLLKRGSSRSHTTRALQQLLECCVSLGDAAEVRCGVREDEG